MYLKKAVICAVLIVFGAVLIVRPQVYIPVCFEGICLWAECVLPSLFPFMIISTLLIKLGVAEMTARPFAKISTKLNLPSAAVPLFLMGACCGYPAGSRILCEYREMGMLDSEDVKKLAPLCSACGPLFALGTVGTKAFNDGIAGIKLYCACLISVVTTSLLYCLVRKRGGVSRPLVKVKQTDILQSTFYGAVTACLTAGGFICFFYTLSKVFVNLGAFKALTIILSPLFGAASADALCMGLCEATGGCFALAAAGGFFALPLTGFLVTFGGVSIALQQLAYLTKHGVTAKYFIAFKLIQGGVCFALLCLMSLI